MKVALALGSGGARGWAHIGVLQVLHERGHEVSAIAGTSVGALIGGLQAAGALDAFTEWITALNQRELLMPVSYTHLDVYKRQGDGGSSRPVRGMRRHLTSRTPPRQFRARPRCARLGARPAR